MPKDFDNYNNITNNGNQSYRASKRSTVKTVDPDVAGARKAYDDIFKYAKSVATDFNESYTSETAKTMKSVANITLNTYSKMYKSMEDMHRSYLSNMVKREFAAANEVSRAWSNARSGSPVGNPTSSFNNSGGSYDIGKSMKGISDNLDSTLNKFTSNNEDIMSEGAEKIGNKTGSAVSKIGTKLLAMADKYFNIWIQRFQRGINNISNTYESTYTNVSVLMRQNQEQYMSWQTAATNEITSRGLKDNIAISEVMKTLDQVVSMGISGQDAQNKALADTINRTLAPFVDTTSDAYTDLQLTLGSVFTDNLTGMGAYLQDIAGSSRVFKNSINDVVTKLEPVQLYAEKQLMTGEEYAMVEQLVNSGLMTTSQAVELVSQASQVVSDQYGALTNGNTAQAIAVAGGHTNSLEDALTSMIGSTTILQNNSALAQGAAINAYGVGGWLSQASDMTLMYDLVRNFNATGSTYDYAKRLNEEFARGDFTTPAAARDYWSENTMLGVTQFFKQKYPDAYFILEQILSSVSFSGIFNSLSNFFGKGGGDSIAKSIFTKDGIKEIGSSIKNAVSGINPGQMAAGGTMAAGGIVAIKLGADEIGSGQRKVRYGGSAESSVGATQTALGGVAVAGGATALAIGGATMAAGAGATGAVGGLAAAGPVGWIALAAAGVAIAISKTVEHYSKLNKAINSLRDSYSEQRESMEQYNKTLKEQADSIKENYDNLAGIEEKRSFLISNGIATEEELVGKSTAALDNMAKTYQETEHLIANGGLTDFEYFFTKTLDIFGTIPDNLGDVFYKKLQEADEKALKDKQEDVSEEIAKQLVNASSLEERKEILAGLGVDFDNIESDAFSIMAYNRMLESNDINDVKNALNQGTGMFGWNGSVIERAFDDNASMDQYIKDRGLNVSSNFEDHSEIGRQITEAMGVVEAGKRTGITKLFGDQRDLYNKSLNFLSDPAIYKEIGEYSGTDLGIYTDRTKYPIAGNIDEAKATYQYLASGDSYISTDGLRYLHKGEAVLNKYQNRDYMRAAAITKLFGTGSSAADLLSNIRSNANNDNSSDYGEITDAISACARLIVDAINSMRDNNRVNTDDNSVESLMRRAYSRRSSNDLSSEALNMVNLQPSMVG